MVYMVRRNGWGEDSCKYVQDEWPELKIINKDKDPIPMDDWAIRWATTSDLPGRPKVINKAGAIHTVYNKGAFRQTMAEAGLAPKTKINEYPTDDMYPVVLRPLAHKASEELYIASNKKELDKEIKKLKKETGDDFIDWYVSSFVDKDREFRVFVVSGRVVAMLEKFPADANDVSWGVGGKWGYVRWSHWPIEVCRVSCAAFKLSGLDFGAVDMISVGKKAYCLEINTGPQLDPYYGQQLAKGIRYMVEKNDRSFIEPGNERDFKAYIHPALI